MHKQVGCPDASMWRAQVLGLEEAVANPSLIHVAGTKGKVLN